MTNQPSRFGHPLEVSSSFLNRSDIPVLPAENHEILYLKLCSSSPRYDVGCDKSLGKSLGNDAIVFIPEFEGAWAIIVTVNQQDSICSHFYRVFCAPEGLPCGVTSSPGHEKGLSRREPDRLFNDLVVFIPFQSGGFTCGSRRYKIRPLPRLENHVFLKALIVHFTVGQHGSDQSRPTSLKPFEPHDSSPQHF